MCSDVKIKDKAKLGYSAKNCRTISPIACGDGIEGREEVGKGRVRSYTKVCIALDYWCTKQRNKEKDSKKSKDTLLQEKILYSKEKILYSKDTVLQEKKRYCIKNC